MPATTTTTTTRESEFRYGNGTAGSSSILDGPVSECTPIKECGPAAAAPASVVVVVSVEQAFKSGGACGSWVDSVKC